MVQKLLTCIALFLITLLFYSGCGEDNDKSIELPVQDTTAPGPSLGLYAESGDAFVDLKWSFNSEPDLAGYNLYRSLESGIGYERLNPDSIKGNAYRDTGVTNGITYYYIVKPVDAYGNEGRASNEVRIMTVDKDFEAALQLYANGKDKESASAFQRYLDSHSENELTDDALYFLALSHYWLKEYELSKSEFTELLAKYPESNRKERVKIRLACFIGDSGDYKEAIAQFQAALAETKDPDTAADALIQSGYYYDKAGLYNEAIESFQRLLALYPDARTSSGELIAPTAYRNIGVSYYRWGKYRQSTEAYQKGLQLYPHSHEAAITQYYIGDDYLQLSDYTTAIAEFQKVIDNYPDSEWADDAQYDIARCYEKLNDYPKAIVEYQKVIAEYPQSDSAPWAQHGIGSAYETLIDYEKAIQAYRKTAENYPDSEAAPASQFRLGWSYRTIGKYEQALSEWQTLIEKYPGTKWAAEAVKLIELTKDLIKP
jgi:tetratricopeptide (TPR) repeat protein